MMERVKIGLIGAGVFAGYHADKLAAHSRVEFVGVVDKDPQAAKILAVKYGVKTLTLPQLLDVSDAVVIATPATTHGPIAIQALRAGCHCLIEKPIATTAVEADEIIALAASQKLTVQIGHQERMVLRAIGLDKVKERPLKVQAVRHSPYSKRGTDTSVTLDLMSHDIDLCTALMGGAPKIVSGQAGLIMSKTYDMSQAHLSYESGEAYLESSRVADISERRMIITYSLGRVEIDFNAKTLVHSTPYDLNTNFADDPRAKDSLGSATDVFVRAIIDKTPVLVSAHDGAIAAKTALQIDGFGIGER